MNQKTKPEYKTTTGELQWSDLALHVNDVPDPIPPSDDPGWTMIGSTMTEVRNSTSTVLWFWRREVLDYKDVSPDSE